MQIDWGSDEGYMECESPLKKKRRYKEIVEEDPKTMQCIIVHIISRVHDSAISVSTEQSRKVSYILSFTSS